MFHICQSISLLLIKTLKLWGGKLIEIPFAKGVSGTNMQDYLRAIGITPDLRRRQLRRLIDSKKIVRIIEAHNGLTGLVAENVKFEDKNSSREFDGMWASSLTDSTSRGKPDIEAVDLTSRITNIKTRRRTKTKRSRRTNIKRRRRTKTKRSRTTKIKRRGRTKTKRSS